MQKLHSKDHVLLKEKVIKLLHQNKITTILDFLQEDVEKLSTLAKLSLPQILSIRLEYFNKYSAPVINGNALFTKCIISKKFISTGLSSLDNITGGGIPVGFITELYGLAGSGKTQLLFQVAINCASNNEGTILYIDTKGDFSAVRVQKMLQAHGYSHKNMAAVLMKIKIVHIWSLDELIEFLRRIKNRTEFIENLSVILIDSLPCLMFQYLGDDCKVGLSALNVFVNYCNYLCKEMHLSIVCVNIQTRWVDQNASDLEDDIESSVSKETVRIEKRNRCLGRYWQHIPALVLLVERTKDCENGSAEINISVTKSAFGVSNLSCTLKLSELGVT
ncbi:unnamed protein product [Plutella xylostella]|uniref:(diamondback moth) hypothetical protein n=1 Tax=Plutella xylostella TaxID=51655 RepID=A0A8S4DAZ1_PLUXY|nr:unnamed protein product [Plutella xylostella]